MTVTRFFLVATGALLGPAAGACPWCRDDVQEAVYSPDFLGTTLLLLLPLLLIAAVGAGLYLVDRGGASPSDP